MTSPRGPSPRRRSPPPPPSCRRAAPLRPSPEAPAPRPAPETLLAARRDVMSAVRDLATLTDGDMEKEWDWKGDSEIELRYAFFNVLEVFERAGIDAATAARIVR